MYKRQEQRRANVEMLLSRAENFEKTSYFGLFHFIRYMEQVEKYNIDYGEANIQDENADTCLLYTSGAGGDSGGGSAP